MIFDPPLIPVRFLRRSKRFLVDIQFEDGSTGVAHLKNTGRMTGCDRPGSPALVTPVPPGPNRLRWNLRLIRPGRAWVAVDTTLANQVIGEALRAKKVPGLEQYDQMRPEAAYGSGGRSRIDFLLEDPAGEAPRCFVEVKNVTLRQGRTALFPDAVSARGLKHLRELAEVARRGERAVLIPLVARADCDRFGVASDIDPKFAHGLEQACAAGLEVRPMQARIERSRIRLRRAVPWERSP